MSKTELFVTAVNDWNVFMYIEWRSMLFTNAIEELRIMIIIIIIIIIKNDNNTSNNEIELKQSIIFMCLRLFLGLQFRSSFVHHQFSIDNGHSSCMP